MKAQNNSEGGAQYYYATNHRRAIRRASVPVLEAVWLFTFSP